MKTLLLFAVVLFLAFSFVQAQEKVELQVNKYGEIRIAQEDNWRDLTEAEEKAFKNSGTEFPNGEYNNISERLDFFHQRVDKKYSQVVLYDGQKLITLEKEMLVKGESEIALYIILLLVGILIGTIAIIKDRVDKIEGFFTLSVIYFITSLTAVVRGANYAGLLVLAPALFFLFSSFSFQKKRKKLPILLLIFYYISSGIALFI